MIGQLFNRTLTYGLLVAATGAGYVYGVAHVDAWFGLSSDWLAPPQVAAAGVVAALFHPIRVRLESWADRLVYGRRITAGQAVAQITALGRSTGEGGPALRELARIIALGLGTGTAAVRLDLADGSAVSYAWPEEARTPEETRDHPVSYQHTVVGAIVVPGGRAPAPRRRALLDRLTQSAGVILHNAALTIELEHRLSATEQRAAEIRASRWRIVAAEDSERRELERDLHDGAQPGLTAVRLGLGLVTHLAKAGKTAGVRAAPEDLRAQIDHASAGICQTLRGLDPEVLRESGIAAAIRELAQESGVLEHARIKDETNGLRLRADLEAAAYFCCAEALQNAAKHSPGAPVSLTLTQTLDAGAARLCFEIRDEGPGFELSPEPRPHLGVGSGLQNMADRAAAVGGTLRVASALGRGTVVSGWVPGS